jgi:choline dehydrogenase
MSRPAFEVGGYVRSDAALQQPDIRLLVNLVTIDSAAVGMQLEREPSLTIGGYQMTPSSRGYLEIVSPNPKDAPSIVMNALDQADDRDAAIRLVHYISKLAQTSALASYGLSEVFPGHAVQTDKQILGMWRRFASSGMRISGACRMGVDEASVVDPQLRVRGVDNLFVADISVLPTVVSGNTNVPAMALGHLAADRIRQAGSNVAAVSAGSAV